MQTRINKKENNFMKNILILLVFIASINISYGLPVPHGLDGIIYELDGITQVRKGIDFYVYNLNNDYIISGKTGYGSSGRYSVAIKGNDGDTIVIKAWNKYNQVNATLTLNGVMRNVNLLLNMTYPPLAPNITSQPITNAIEDQLYTYDVEAFDENEEDILEYNLIEAPIGMSINESTGLIEWAPLQQHVGNNDVIVQVSDGLFLINQSFTINVENVNDKPEIISIPITDTTEDVNYFYDVDAIDEDNDILIYSLIEKPNGMIINENTGLINWTPSNYDVGIHQIIIQVSDGNLTDEQEFTINVANANDLPVITSLPVTNAVQDKLYNYDVEAYDVDDDTLTYSLVNFPQGMSINNINGNITWLPGNDDVGIHNITVKVSDDDGFVLQPYALIVENVNDKPVINSIPLTEARVFRLYAYDVDAYDVDNDTLTYSLIKKPKLMRIDRDTGLIRWIPRFRDIGKNEVIVEVSDGNLTDRQGFIIFVSLRGRSSSGSDSKSTFIKKLEIGESEIIINTFTSSNEITVKELNKRPDYINKISRRVYKYLRIENMETIEEAILNFTVDLKWLNENEIKYGDIILTGYTDDEWEDLKTEYVGNDEKFAYYTAKTPGFSYFAITVKDGITVKSILNPQISSIKTPFRITGTVYKFGKFAQADAGTKFIIKNLNNSEIVEGETGIGPYTGAYSVLMHGNEGDLIKIKISNLDKEFLTALRDIDNLDFMLDLHGSFNRITGYSVFGKFLLEKINIVSVISLIIVILLAIFIKSKYKKNW